MAVSGQNVTLVAGMLVAALAWVIGRRPAAWLALAAVIGYALLVGGEPSVVRAAIMGSLYVIAVALGRQSAAPVALCLAGAVMTAVSPQIVHEVSFQLSFAATLGLMTLSPLLAARAEALVQRWPGVSAFPLTRPALELATVTLAAIAFTLPITAINFQRISLVAPLTNLLVVPAFLLVAITATVTAVAGIVLPASAEVMRWLAWPTAAYMVEMVRLTAGLPLAAAEVRGVGTGHAIVYYGALFAVIWLLGRRPSQAVDSPPLAEPSSSRTLLPAPGMALVLALASAVLWLSLTAPDSGRLTVTFLDVGQGDAILIEGPEGHRVLVDGGPSGEAITGALGRRLPFYDRRLDLVVLTHPQADHVGGLPAVLQRYDVGAALVSPLEGDSVVYRAWRDALRDAGIPHYEAAPGHTIDLGDGAHLYVLAAPETAPDPNEASVVIKLSMGRASYLLTGDIGARGEFTLLRSGADLRAIVHKVAHHGSDTSSSEEFLAAVGPLLHVISVDEDNRFGHPSPAVMERLDGSVFRTDFHGDISISTDGRRLWIKTSR